MTAPRRLNADHLAIVVLTVLFGILIAAASFVLSFHGLRDVATWGRVPIQLAWLVPVMIDAAVLCYTLAWLVQRARRESTALSWFALVLMVAVSTLGNTLHGWEPSTEIQRIVGTAVVGLAPLAMLLASHTIAQLLTAPIRRTDTVAAADTTTATTAPTTTAPTTGSIPTVTSPTTGSIPAITAVVSLDAARAVAARRHARTQTRRHRPRTPDRLALAAQIRELRAETPQPSFNEIARRVGISRSRAHAIYQEAATS
ncbi:DUF2637 domain-containing protein [Promicromonospora sp. NPDC023805]|uniref:DUF2637 domain-containing protein n=1 Tax=Promicromonospora sp. NPDC023805 TaxID=3154696 RepID=UPI00340CAD74